MNTIDARQVYNILQNLMNLEISYMEYSNKPHNFEEYQTYTEYFDNYVLRSKDLYRFYFPMSLSSATLPKSISDIGDVTDALNIMSGYDYSVSKMFNFPGGLRHKCNYYSLFYQMEGTTTITLDESTHGLRAGDFFLISPDIYYSVETSMDGLCICINLRKSYLAAEYKTVFLRHPALSRFITESIAEEEKASYAAIHTDGNEEIRQLILSIFAEYIKQDEYSNVVMRSYLPLLFAAAFRAPETKIETAAKVTRMDEQFREIEMYLQKNYQTASLTELADTIHFSKQYICRIVKEKTGDTFNALLMQTRLKIAEQYLVETELSLEEIAYLCGFSAASHMSRTFKEAYQMTPSAYRKARTAK